MQQGMKQLMLSKPPLPHHSSHFQTYKQSHHSQHPDHNMTSRARPIEPLKIRQNYSTMSNIKSERCIRLNQSQGRKQQQQKTKRTSLKIISPGIFDDKINTLERNLKRISNELNLLKTKSSSKNISIPHPSFLKTEKKVVKENAQAKVNKSLQERVPDNPKKDENTMRKTLQTTTKIKMSCPKPIHSDQYLLKSISHKDIINIELKKSYLNSYIPMFIPKREKKSLSISDFVLEEKVGEGRFGTVFRAIEKKTGSVFALKKQSKSEIQKHGLIDQFIKEVKLQSFLGQNQNIVSLYGLFHDETHIYLILEYFQDGTLYQKEKKLKEQIKGLEGKAQIYGILQIEREVAVYIKQIVKALHYMHENEIIHRDIKPENIMMNGGVCKLGDFGWATDCHARRRTACGTFDYSAPEIIEGNLYDKSVDLWCIGILSYELLLGKAPFYHISRKQTVQRILNVENFEIKFPPFVSEKLKSFVVRLLKRSPEERMTTWELLQHPFLREVEKQTAK